MSVLSQGSGWREEFSEGVRQLLTEEVSASNPPFPIQRFLTRFLKRRADHLQQPTASGQTAKETPGPPLLKYLVYDLEPRSRHPRVPQSEILSVTFLVLTLVIYTLMAKTWNSVSSSTVFSLTD